MTAPPSLTGRRRAGPGRGGSAAGRGAAVADPAASIVSMQAAMRAELDAHAAESAKLATALSDKVAQLSAQLAGLKDHEEKGEHAVGDSPSTKRRRAEASAAPAAVESGRIGPDSGRIGPDSAESGRDRLRIGSASPEHVRNSRPADDDDYGHHHTPDSGGDDSPADVPGSHSDDSSDSGVAMLDELWDLIPPSFLGPPRHFATPASGDKPASSSLRSHLAASWPASCLPLSRADRDRRVKAGAPVGARSDLRWTRLPLMAPQFEQMLRGKGPSNNTAEAKDRRCTMALTLAHDLIPKHTIHLMELLEYLCGIYCASPPEGDGRGFVGEAIRLLTDSATSLTKGWNDALFAAAAVAVHKPVKAKGRYAGESQLAESSIDLEHDMKAKKLFDAATAASAPALAASSAGARSRGGRSAFGSSPPSASRGSWRGRGRGRGRAAAHAAADSA